MTARTPARASIVAALVVAGFMALTAVAANASEVIYTNIPAPLPGNVPSQAFEATSTSEFGGQVQFAGTSRTKVRVTVAMSSWACQSGGAEDGSCITEKGATFNWPVTLHIYAVGPENSIGIPIAGLTKSFKMPYRPSASPKCTGEGLGGWYRAGGCFHGKMFRIAFTLKGVTLPSKAIISVAYNTSDYGAEPQSPQPCNTAGNCPYDSLNVATTGVPTIGSDPLVESAYLSSTWGGAYCDGGSSGTGTFRLDAGCWAGYQPDFAVTTG
jgi:hypothetical protein